MSGGKKENPEIVKNIHLFKCPVCGERMNMPSNKSIVCNNKHNYDLSKSGYINLLQHSVKTEYSKNMFTSRNIICNTEFFEPMINFISDILIDKIQGRKSKAFNVLDVGCGEGTHLAQITNSIRKRTSTNILGVGLDISKDGIQMASKNYPHLIWFVADLTRIPLVNKQFNTVLNILSPSNYAEFKRIINNDGLIVKVVPGSDYLKELRKAFYNNTDKGTYSNENIISHFGSNFNIIDIQRLLYNVKLSEENFRHLIKMTPLSWRATDEQIENALQSRINSVTVDISIIIGQVSPNSSVPCRAQ